MPERRTGAAWLLVSLLGAPLLQAGDVALLKSTDAPAWRPALETLRKGLVGQTVTEFDFRGDRNEADRVVASLRSKPNAILVAMGPLAAQAVREGAPETLLVYCMVQDPGKIGLLNNVNASGVAFTTPVKNQLAAFRMVNPRGVRVGVVYGDESSKYVQEAQKAAPVVRLAMAVRPIASERDVPQALRSLLTGAEAVDAIWLPPDALLLSEDTRRYILAETLKAGKPVYSFSAALVTEGALVSNGPDMPSIGEQVAELVTRLATGDKTARGAQLIPRAELVVNKKIAEKLRLEIPADALKAASRVF
jgi:putative tryptophan/tyrosine transport system substrate-binding protein